MRPSLASAFLMAAALALGHQNQHLQALEASSVSPTSSESSVSSSSTSSSSSSSLAANELESIDGNLIGIQDPEYRIKLVLRRYVGQSGENYSPQPPPQPTTTTTTTKTTTKLRNYDAASSSSQEQHPFASSALGPSAVAENYHRAAPFYFGNPSGFAEPMAKLGLIPRDLIDQYIESSNYEQLLKDHHHQLQLAAAEDRDRDAAVAAAAAALVAATNNNNNNYQSNQQQYGADGGNNKQLVSGQKMIRAIQPVYMRLPPRFGKRSSKHCIWLNMAGKCV